MTEPKPDTLNYEKRADGVQVALLKPPLYRRSMDALLTAIVGAFVILGLTCGFSWLFYRISGSFHPMLVLLPLFALFMAPAIVASETQWNREAAVLDIGNGYLTFVRSTDTQARQWPLKDLATVRAWALGLTWELRIELKSGQIVRVLKGRSRRELQLAASLLREALRGPSDATPPAPLPSGVTFIEGGECQICGAQMSDHLVFCAKCRTPHHEECWTYNGACSTYGCREIRWTRTA